MRKSVDELHARRMLGGGPVLLVTTRWRDQVNVAPMGWHMPVSIIPPLVAIAVHPSRRTHDMIRSSEEFAINIPGPRLLDHVHYYGVVGGNEINKVEAGKLPTFAARRVIAPLLDHCVGWIECGLEDTVSIGDHTLFIGRVAAVQVDDEAFDDVWLLDDEDARPLHYIGAERYSALGEVLYAKVRTTESGAIDAPAPADDETPDDVERREQEQFERQRAEAEAVEKQAQGQAAPPGET
ncbi:MAG: flavin reductase family protein [Dehalococcoidia bacterium]|nr:flavin reductase family protein [Dehalococcoidia bacterium]